MIKKIDKFNRITVPKDMQKLLGIKVGQSVNIEYDNDKIIIYPYLKETIRSFMTNEHKLYTDKLNEATEENNEKEIYLYMGAKIELEKCLNKYDELY